MKSKMLIAASGALFAVDWPSLPTFDWQAALIVGTIVTAAVVVVIVVAIATPFVAISAGATYLGTGLAVGAIALVTGLIGGTAAGYHWGKLSDIKRQEQIESIRRVSNQLDIHFEPSAGDPKRAAEFRCNLVSYEETDLKSRQPTVTTKKKEILATNSEEFRWQVEQQMKRWFAKQVGGDTDGQPRRVLIYMTPYPGEGIYERFKQIAEDIKVRRSVVIRNDGDWESALSH